jgi:threonine synthase
MSHLQVECLDCGHRTPFTLASPTCPQCGGEWREARYNYQAAAARWPHELAGRPFDMWRYAELLPVRQAEAPQPGLPIQISPQFTLGEGGTPLYRAANLSLMLGHPHLFIKDERQGPTSSFKDRQAALVVAGLKEAGITSLVVASTGNVAIAYSAYCARAGIKLWAFLTSLVPAEKMREVAMYGTQVVKVGGTYDQAKKLAAEFARQRGLYLDRGTRGVLQVESMKTLAFEIAEQLGRLLPSQSPITNYQSLPWRAPDWYVQSVSGGIGPLGVLKGFAELQQIGLTSGVPALAAIQTEGCAPMADGFRAGLDTAPVVFSPQTNIATLSTGDPGRAYTLLRQRTEGTRSVFDSVSDDEAFRAMHILAKMEGVACEPAAAVAFAGVIKLIRQGTITPADVIVINCSGHTFPVEKEILGDGWEKQVTAADVAGEAAPEAGARAHVPARAPQEGLMAALGRLDSRTRSIAIIEDHADARRLLRRILQARGRDAFEIYEAENGATGVNLARRYRPDLILLDLMMPGMDGFAVLDALKADPLTAEIPIIVVTAKSLTVTDAERLTGKIESILQKGAFMDEDLFREIEQRLI